MPRRFVRKLGARHYRNYSPLALAKAVEKCLAGKATIRAASEEFNIPTGTICAYLKSAKAESAAAVESPPEPGQPANPVSRKKSPGHPTVFSPNEEEILCALIVAVGTYGFPCSIRDLKVIVRSYLDKMGRTVPVFKENTPGIDWVKLFLKRHPDITRRTGRNIPLSRAAVNKDTIRDYFHHLRHELEGVPHCNIYN
ncbi:PREDICTED: uncharacterized protein LOC106750002 [Dinoponera quadriceps]|uniref:Uncharacterized protein LOC106750002 n=1 Tax=Dinoponera quadriceps TaxID=609295 RepID=A0A6P3Y3P6_DINQU|nr:PREDICTED: uncharacterized protein LOC106750002 [Dinoponera quadriceps]